MFYHEDHGGYFDIFKAPYTYGYDVNEYDEYGNPKKFSKHEEKDEYGNLKGKTLSKFI